MKRGLPLAAVALLLLGLLARAQTPDEQYVRIYGLIQQADALNNADQPAAALARYREAQAALERFQKHYPEWNPKVVNFRLNYLARKIESVTARLPAAPTAPAPATSTAPVTPPPGAPAPVAPAPEAVAALERQINALQEQVRQLQSDKGVLELKLREALAVRPAETDPRELARAQERIASLLKENELLKATLERESARTKTAAAERELNDLRATLDEATRKLREQTGRADALEVEKRALENRLESLKPSLENLAQLDRLKAARDEAERKLAEQTAQVAGLKAEVESLRQQLEKAAPAADALEALRAENALLKRQLEDARREAQQTADLRTRLTAAEVRLAALQSDTELLRLEKTALEQRVREARATAAVAASAPPTPVSRPEDLKRIRELEAERDALLRKLEAAQAQASQRSSRATAAQVRSLTEQLAALQARLQVYEAKAVPFTPEELALLKVPQPALPASPPVATGAVARATSAPPPAAGTLVLEAQRAFAAHRYDEAEEKYQQLLRLDEHNTFTLANLAMIQLEQGRLNDAEQTLAKALALAPQDARVLAALGYLRFRQQRYDEALDALGRSAALDPNNAEVQNHLGVALNHKGLRGPAETALRRAIQLDPKFGAAHNNLAVIYATQQPPALELARWHYQRALANGHPRNPELEKLLENRAAPGASTGR